jgi:hypothetical protein
MSSSAWLRSMHLSSLARTCTSLLCRRTSGTRGCAPGGRTRRSAGWSCAYRGLPRNGTPVGGWARLDRAWPLADLGSRPCSRQELSKKRERQGHLIRWPVSGRAAMLNKQHHICSTSTFALFRPFSSTAGTAVPPTPANIMGYVALFGYRGADTRRMDITRNEGVTGVTGGLSRAQDQRPRRCAHGHHAPSRRHTCWQTYRLATMAPYAPLPSPAPAGRQHRLVLPLPQWRAQVPGAVAEPGSDGHAHHLCLALPSGHTGGQKAASVQASVPPRTAAAGGFARPWPSAWPSPALGAARCSRSLRSTAPSAGSRDSTAGSLRLPP